MRSRMAASSRPFLPSIVLATATLLASCRSASSANDVRPQSPERAVELRIEHLPGEDAWRVTGTLPAATPMVRFRRGSYENRHQEWRVVGDAIVLDKADGED